MVRAVLIVGDRGGRYPSSTNVLVKGGRLTVLLDAGAGPAALSDVLHKVDVVVVSHVHPDHVRNLGMFKGRRVLVPAYDSAFEDLESLARRYAPGVYQEWLKLARWVGAPDRVPYTGTYEEGDKLCLGEGDCLEFVLMPGHTSCHHAALLPDGSLYGADVDLTEFGPWYGNPESSLPEFINDVMLVAELAPTSYYSAHLSRAVGRGELPEALAGYVARVFDSAGRLLGLLRSQGQARPSELVDRGVVYPKKMTRFKRVFDYFEEVMLRKLFELLTSVGCVSRGPDGYRLLSGDCEGRLERLRERVVSAVRGALGV